MEPQLLIASLYEHASTTGQHDIIPADAGGAKFDTVGVIIALLAMIGIMVAMAMMGGDSAVPIAAPQNTHLMMSTR
jgi:hypothetical protein